MLPNIGIGGLILILLIVFVLFGAGKLPRVMGDIGKGIRSMREGLKEGEKEEGEEQKSLPGNDSTENKT